MTDKEKELLLKDLCARLPYHSKISILETSMYTSEIIEPLESISQVRADKWFVNDVNMDETVKPYLRPMSSMTEEEKIESLNFAWEDDYGRLASYNENISKYIDWLNAHHFDYRGLIEKGLALEAPEEMYGVIIINNVA